MRYVRGNKKDFDNWAQQGNPGRDYESILPYFKKSENFHGYETQDSGKSTVVSYKTNKSKEYYCIKFSAYLMNRL